MRGAFAVLGLLLVSACTPDDPAASPLSLPSTPITLAPEFAHVRLPDREPPAPGCPKLRVFADEKQLCERGIEPLSPFGTCRSASTFAREKKWARFETHSGRVAALGGTVEVFVSDYVGSGAGSNETLYLALRNAHGITLLAELTNHNSHVNDMPEIDRFVGTPTNLELDMSQIWYEWEPEFDEVVRHTSIRCNYDDEGGLRCNDTCPSVGVAEAMPDLDCGALTKFDWSTLPVAEDAEWYAGIVPEVQFHVALGYLKTHGHARASARARARYEETFELPGIERSFQIEPHAYWADIYEFADGPRCSCAATSPCWPAKASSASVMRPAVCS